MFFPMLGIRTRDYTLKTKTAKLWTINVLIGKFYIYVSQDNRTSIGKTEISSIWELSWWTNKSLLSFEQWFWESTTEKSKDAMPRKLHVVTSKFTEIEKIDREPQSRKLRTKNISSYVKDEIMATVEQCEKKSSEKWKYLTRE